MKLNLSQAARLYGKQRKTLYRHIESGRLSSTIQGDGRQVVDMSELIRCYGEPPGQPDTEKTHPPGFSDTGLTHRLIAELVELNRQQAEQLATLSGEVRQLREQMQRLPPPSPPEAPTAPPQQPQEPKVSNHPLRSLADVLARFEGRQ